MSEHLLRGVVGISIVAQLPPTDAQDEAVVAIDESIERGFVTANSIAVEQFQIGHG